MFPCPRCTQEFSYTDDLLNHVLRAHSSKDLSNLLRRRMKQLTKDDFIQTDSQWIYAIGKFHLALIPNEDGTFSLHIYGSVDPIPKATQYPTGQEWERELKVANKFLDAYLSAVNKDELK